MPALKAPVRSRRSRRTITAVASVLAATALMPAAAHASQVEQINRTDGVAGASPIESSTANGVITDDGTTVYLNFNQDWGTWATATGFWQRNLATNRTTQIVGGFDSVFGGFGADANTIGVLTKQRLVSADTNSLQDVYVYDAAAKRFTLGSRRDGANGTATGLALPNSGRLTRDGKAVLFTNNAGVQRRDLITGRTTTVATGRLGGGTSDDGTVFSLDSNAIVSPSGVRSIAIPGSNWSNAAISPSGRWAIVTASPNQGTGRVGYLLDVTTGNQTPLAPWMLDDSSDQKGFTADDRALFARSTSTSSTEIVSVTLPTLAQARVSTYSVPRSDIRAVARNGQFAVLVADQSAYAASADGVALPGGADLPSPGIYAKVYEGCRNSGFPYYYAARPSSLARFVPGPAYLPALRSYTLRVMQSSGAPISTTVIPGTGADHTAWPKLPVGPFRLSVTADYVDGRTTTESWSILAPRWNCGVI